MEQVSGDLTNNYAALIEAVIKQAAADARNPLKAQRVYLWAAHDKKIIPAYADAFEYDEKKIREGLQRIAHATTYARYHD